MNNYEVIQTMTVKELANLLSIINKGSNRTKEWERWLRAGSQVKGGLLADELKKYWRVH